MSDADFWKSDEGIGILREGQGLYKEAGSVQKLILIWKKRNPSLSSSLMKEAVEILEGREILHTFSWRKEGLFTKQGLEQSTDPFVASYHASHFKGCTHVLEVCGGIGGDTASLAQVAHRVTTLERDPRLASFLQENLRLQGITNVTVEQKSVEEFMVGASLDQFDGLWADPSRRTESGKRILDPEQFSPPLSMLLSLPIVGVKGIKISPSATIREPLWQSEWLGVKDECREHILWKLHADEPFLKVTLLHSGAIHQRTFLQRTKSERWSAKPEEITYLIEPHATICAAHLWDSLFTEEGVAHLNREIPYGISNHEPLPSVWFERFHIRKVTKGRTRDILQALEELSWGREITIKKRGIREEPSELRKLFSLSEPSGSGEEQRKTLILTKDEKGSWWAFLGVRMDE